MKKTNNRFKKILLIKPPGTIMAGYTTTPISLLCLAAYLRKIKPEIKIAIIDGTLVNEEGIIEKLNRFKPDLVGVSVMTAGRHEGFKVARIIKKIRPKCKIIFGGVHPTLMFQQMMENYPEIDYIAIGEGEIILTELASGKPLSKIKGLVWRDNQKKIINNRCQKLITNLDSLPLPAWDLIEPLKYPARGKGIINGLDLSKEVRFSIIFSRGCLGKCTFCSSWRIWKGYRSRSGKNVFSEVELLYRKYQARHFCFYDDTLLGDRKAMVSFCQEILRKKLKIAVSGDTRVDLVDREILKLMKKAGFYQLNFGVESGSEQLLLKINKQTNPAIIKKAFFLTKKAGLLTTALMMYGLPGETAKDRKLTQKLLTEIRPDGVGTVGEVWILPGTTLYEQAKTAGLINDCFWLGKRPCYIYRGGLEKDLINWRLKIWDWWRFNFNQTFFWLAGAKLFFYLRGVLTK